MPRRGFEAYPQYQRYVGQGRYWPSESNGETVLIEEMVPRYAASALEKLCRWARLSTTYAHINHSDVNGREMIVRNSLLGQALAQRAQGLSLVELPPAQEVTPREMILAFAPIVAEHSNLDITTIFKLCEALATKADEEWTVTVQSR